MRKPFRTTIEEKILIELKKRTVDNNCNVNDIIEKAVLDEMHREYFPKHDNEFEEMTLLHKEQHFQRKLTKAISDTLNMFSLESGFVPFDLMTLLAGNIAKIAVSKLQCHPK